MASGEEAELKSAQNPFWETLWHWFEQRSRLIALFIGTAAGVSVSATYLAWTGTVPSLGDPNQVLSLLLLDLVLLLCLGALVARWLVRVWLASRTGVAGSRLHIRFTVLFSVVAVAPAIIVAVFSATFMYFGVQSWFSDQVGRAVKESVAVAEAYMKEHRNTIVADIFAMANDVNRNAGYLSRDPDRFDRFLSAQVALRALGEAAVFDGSGRISARTSLSLAASFDGVPTHVLTATRQATGGKVVLIASENEDQVGALLRLDQFLDHYLYIARFVDPQVLAHVRQTRSVASEYQALEGIRFDVQLTAVLIFTVIAFMLLLFAVWIGLAAANRLVTPISDLANAAERLRLGDFDARVKIDAQDDELGVLAGAFNRMTEQLGQQQKALVATNRQLDNRRRFTEAVLGGVSSGVISLKNDGTIIQVNLAAEELLESAHGALLGRKLVDAVPEMAGIVDEARLQKGRLRENNVQVVRNGHPHKFLLRVTSQPGEGKESSESENLVLTFDDVTELVNAQRMAAWADVARRIAHEIKNPLTPIQLSAERLKRRFMKDVGQDREIFEQCADTIIRNVDDIGRMVDEFSDFARMPAPVFNMEDVQEIIHEAAFAQKLAHDGVTFEFHAKETPVMLRCDRRQITQVFTNLLQNAAEGISARAGEGLEEGRVEVFISPTSERIMIAVCDNGRGFPKEDRDRLTEPYVTHREKGTGLGLAIVKKIVEDHGGQLRLEDNPDGGAVVLLDFETPET